MKKQKAFQGLSILNFWRTLPSLLGFLISIGTINAQEPETTAFIDVNVIPMDEERILKNQTVVVNEGIIVQIGPKEEVKIPQESKVIKGNGNYLMPGLADMHTHLTYDDNPSFMLLYLSNGVTTVRNLNAIPTHMIWRQQVINEELLGPTIYTSGPTIVGLLPDLKSMRFIFWAMLISGPAAIFFILWLLIWLISKLINVNVDFGRIRRSSLRYLTGLLLLGIILAWSKAVPLNTFTSLTLPMGAVTETEEQARGFVRKQKTSGVDCIKPYDYLTRENYFAVMDEAEKLGMYTAGHIPDQPEVVSVREMIETKQDEVVHVDEFTHEFWIDYDPIASEEGWVEYEIDMHLIDGVAKMVAEGDVAVTATLITNETILLGLEDMEGLLKLPEYRVIHPKILKQWRTRGRFVNWTGQEDYRRTQWRPLLMELTKALHEHGALLTLGTDVTVEGIIPGFSVHQELSLLVEAGLSNFEALAAGTRNAAIITKRMGSDANWGTLEVGNRGNLILLPNNPLEDVIHTRERTGVMVRGEWYSQYQLDQLVNEFIKSF